MRPRIDPDALLRRARRYLAAGRFFLALDLCGQVEHWIDENPGTLDTERLRVELAPVIREAQRLTDAAVGEISRHLATARELQKAG